MLTIKASYCGPSSSIKPFGPHIGITNIELVSLSSFDRRTVLHRVRPNEATLEHQLCPERNPLQLAIESMVVRHGISRMKPLLEL